MSREFVHRSLQVARVEEDHDVQYQSERTDLVFLPLFVALAKLAAGYVPGIRKEPTEGAKRSHSGSIPSLPAGINEDDSDPVSEPRLGGSAIVLTISRAGPES